MMKRPDILNGQTREEYMGRGVTRGDLGVLENDWRRLLLWALEIAGNIYYYNFQNRKDGAWKAMWENQVVVVLVEIVLFDVAGCQQAYMDNRGNSRQEEVLKDLKEFVGNKIQRLKNYGMDLVLKSGGGEVERTILQEVTGALLQHLESLVFAMDGSLGCSDENTGNDLVFFNLLNAIRDIQGRYEYYIGRIENSGELDPALALLIVFLKNYATRVGCFNHQFGVLPDFYLKKVLNCVARPACPDHVWIALEKSSGSGLVKIPSGTRFAAGKGEDGQDLFYAIPADFQLTELQLAEVLTVLLPREEDKLPLFLQCDPDIVRDPDMVTSVRRKVIPLVSTEPVPELFDHEEGNSVYVPLGWMMESPMLDLREGERTVELELVLERGSAARLKKFVEDLLYQGQGESVKEEQIFEDAFFLKASVETGWLEMGDCKTVWDKGKGCLTITFHLSGDMPAVVPCVGEVHGIVTVNPAIQVNLNRKAWLFPYVWAIRTEMERLNVRVKVSELTAVKVYNEFGELDVSVPFYPFGAQARKRSWFVIGCHEMVRKPLIQVTFKCRWQQLLCMDTGFAKHYAQYPVVPPVKNDSFRVETEWLRDRNWEKPEGRVCLFTTREGGDGVEEEGVIRIQVDRNMPVTDMPEENYVLGKARSGFVRIVLAAPEMGFGYELYQQLFAEVMMRNSHKKEPDPLPNLPVVPMMGDIRLDYEAEDSFLLAKMAGFPATRFYQVKPLACTSFFPFSGGRPLELAARVMQRANVLFAFREAVGADRVRMFLDIVMRQDESDVQEHTPVVRWYYNDGKGWNLLPEDSLLRDSTCAFTNIGTIEMLLPLPVRREWLDKDGNFWLWAAVDGDYKGCRLVRGFYMNVAEVVALGGNGKSLPAGTITQSVAPIPGVQSVVQLLEGWGGRPAESSADMSVRIAHRIAHRNRAVNPGDFESLVLQEFPLVEKVKCIPQTESGESFVRVVVMSREQGGKYPLCSLVTLQEIKKRLLPLASAFVRLAVVNPVYEKMQVCCRMKLRTTVPVGETLRRIQHKINHYIAPWLDEGVMPELDQIFSIKGLYTILVNDRGVTELQDVTIYVPKRSKYHFSFVVDGKKDIDEDVFIRPSSYGGVFIPEENHELNIE